MKLWDSLTTCLILLCAVYASPLLQSPQQPTSTKRRGRVAESPPELPPVQIGLSISSTSMSRADTANRDETLIHEPLPNEFEDVVNFIKVTISRMRRSSSLTRNSNRREGGSRGAGAGGKIRGGGRGQGCVLKQIHLNVSDLGLGYRSSEEMIFRYCSGPCRKSETNYDKILYNLIHNRRLPAKDVPPQACCRPIAFDDDLSFLDDSLVYHTVRKHSARRCGCV
uniref:Glial cell line-derived neurotrophic factor n=1 Tax=Neolamprologus brichardi TaxID=32507 RepID=A0A3Q4MMA6_NEOBR